MTEEHWLILLKTVAGINASAVPLKLSLREEEESGLLVLRDMQGIISDP